VEEIVERSGTPYFCFKDLDENKPAGSIRIRVETIAYFLQRHRERLRGARQARAEIDRQLAALDGNWRAAGPVGTDSPADGSGHRYLVEVARE